MNYYNEWDPQAAAWLRELIAERLIPRGLVDERSITEVKAEDLEGFTQCHFFAGIGGWPLALQLAGVPATTQLWTGSPPCQPFSAAGKQLGQFDPRHLAPVFLDLISKCRPPILFGEQVAPAIGKSWMCDLQIHLEREDYAVGFAVLPACSVGAPHKRERLFFGAKQLAYSNGERSQTRLSEPQQREERHTEKFNHHSNGILCGVGRSDSERHNRQHSLLQRAREENLSKASGPSQDRGMANAKSSRRGEEFSNTGGGAERSRTGKVVLPAGSVGVVTANPTNGFWRDADWLGCRDGKFRPVEPGAFPLANGVPARVGRLRGYGNAIVPQVAAEFVTAFMEAAGSTLEV